MKQFLAFFLITAIGCNTASKNGLEMPGAYNMLSVSVKNEKTDTSFSNILQHKIFTSDFIMYANVNPKDSVSSFGVGTYDVSNDTLTEHIFLSAADTTKNEQKRNFNLIIEKLPKGFKQVIPDMEWSGGQKMTLTETYDRVGTDVTSPLDGLWKLVTRYNVKGADTIMGDPSQYKMYYAGEFIFGHTWIDSVNKTHTGIGYGTFKMDGANKVKENILASTYYEIRGKLVDLDIEMNGTDSYKQTITQADGTKNVEIYERVKK